MAAPTSLDIMLSELSTQCAAGVLTASASEDGVQLCHPTDGTTIEQFTKRHKTFMKVRQETTDASSLSVSELTDLRGQPCQAKFASPRSEDGCPLFAAFECVFCN